MKPYKRNYLKSIGAGEQDFVPCEVCGRAAENIHHIHEKGMGGRSGADELDNLIALCYQHHQEAHRNVPTMTKEMLSEIARKRINRRKI